MTRHQKITDALMDEACVKLDELRRQRERMIEILMDAADVLNLAGKTLHGNGVVSVSKSAFDMESEIRCALVAADIRKARK